nr:hypothetical protein [bacterium]
MTLSESETAYFLNQNNYFWQMWKGAEGIYNKIEDKKFEGISDFQSNFLNEN